MNDAHVYEMQVQMWKPNTWGVTDLIKLYELANLSSCRRGTLHRHDLEQLPL